MGQIRRANHVLSPTRLSVPFVLSVLFVPSVCARAAEPTYWRDIRPILRKHCTVCHNARNLGEPDLSGGLALDSYEAVRQGGKSAVVKPGSGSGSLLVTILRHPKKDRRMPRDADALPDESVALLKAWIDAGAREGARPEYDKSVSLDVLLRHLGSVYGNPLPPGVTIDEAKSKTLIGTGNTGHVVLKAAPDAAPVENVPVSVLAHVSINFVVKISYSSPVVPLSVVI